MDVHGTGEVIKVAPEVGRYKPGKGEGFDYVKFELVETHVDSRTSTIHITQVRWFVQWDVPSGQGERFRDMLKPGDLVVINGEARRLGGGVVLCLSYWKPPALHRIGRARGATWWDRNGIESFANGKRVRRSILHRAEGGPKDGADLERGVPLLSREEMVFEEEP